jgi:protein transport protein SEC24
MQLLPLYCMALMKNLAFRGGADIRTDERAFILALLANMPVDHSRCFIYPRMFSLHDMPEDAGLELSSASEVRALPVDCQGG